MISKRKKNKLVANFFSYSLILVLTLRIRNYNNVSHTQKNNGGFHYLNVTYILVTQSKKIANL